MRFIAALGLREWDGISLVGARRTAAVVGLAPPGTPTGIALLDDVTLANAGIKEDAAIVVAPVTVYGAKRVSVSGSALATQSISTTTLRQALLGKVVTVGDTVSLLVGGLVESGPTPMAESFYPAGARGSDIDLEYLPDTIRVLRGLIRSGVNVPGRPIREGDILEALFGGYGA